MQNQFGIKDAALFILVGVLILMVGLSMVQSDRVFVDTQQLDGKVSDLERVLARLNTSIDSFDRTLETLAERGVSMTPTAPGPTGTGLSPDWAAEGVPIERFPVYTFTSDPRAAPAYQPGGTFTELYGAQMPKVMPLIATDVYARRILDQIMEPLGAYNPITLEMEGRLARAWQVDPDGLWVRARLHENATFSDGEPVTADDVVFTWMDFIFNDSIQADRARSISENVENVVALDEHTVEFTFREALFSNLTTAMNTYVLPRHFYERFTPSQINEATSLVLGSGPMRLRTLDVNDQWSQGEDVVLVRNEAYWSGITAPIEEMRFRVIEDALARFTAFTNDEADLITPTPSQFKSRASREDGGEATNPDFLERNDSMNWVNMRSGYSFIAWQCGPRRVDGPLTPFADSRVRRAMTHILDRQFIIDEILEGFGEIATGPEISISPAHSPNVEALEYDPERARALLREAGWVDRDGDGVLEQEDGTEFRFAFTFTRGSPASEKIAKYLSDQCRGVGIICDLDVVDWSQLIQQLDERDFDAITLGWSKSAPESDPRQLWHSTSIADKGDNFMQWASPEADRVIDDGRRELDFDRRMEHWHRLHEIIHEAQPYTFLVERPWLRFAKRRIGNVQEYPEGIQYREFFVQDRSAF